MADKSGAENLTSTSTSTSSSTTVSTAGPSPTSAPQLTLDRTLSFYKKPMPTPFPRPAFIKPVVKSVEEKKKKKTTANDVAFVFGVDKRINSHYYQVLDSPPTVQGEVEELASDEELAVVFHKSNKNNNSSATGDGMDVDNAEADASGGDVASPSGVFGGPAPDDR